MWPSGDRRKVLGPTLCFFFDKTSKADQILGTNGKGPNSGSVDRNETTRCGGRQTFISFNYWIYNNKTQSWLEQRLV
jgi:hypothetical protein